MNHQELIERMRGFEIDHEPNGWPAIQMRDISAMCDAIESLLNALDVADSEVKRTAAELAKYRDAPVVAYLPIGAGIRPSVSSTAVVNCLTEREASEYVPESVIKLIVKPG